jgi:hypothetical protein
MGATTTEPGPIPFSSYSSLNLTRLSTSLFHTVDENREAKPTTTSCVGGVRLCMTTDVLTKSAAPV